MNADLPSTKNQWRDQFNSALDKLASLADIVEDSDPMASRVTEAQESLRELLWDAPSTIDSARFEIDDLLAEYRHEAIAEHMVDVKAEARNIARYCLPYAIACRVADIDVELDDEIDLNDLQGSAGPAATKDEEGVDPSGTRVVLATADESGDDSTLADEIDEDIAEQSRLLRHHLDELKDVAWEAVYAASRGDVVQAIHHAQEVDLHHCAAVAAHEGWFEAVGAMSNVDTGRLGPLGEEIDMFMEWLRTMK